MRLIDADALKKALDELFENGGYDSGLVMNLIDNAPTVDTYTEDDVHYAIKEGHQVGYEMAKAKFKRPQGEWLILNGDKVCPYCGTETSHNTNASIEFFQFCPYCGADMRGGKE